MSNFKTLIRSSMESTDPTLNGTALLAASNSDNLSDDMAVTILDQTLPQIDQDVATADTDHAALESYYRVLDGLDSLQTSLESYDAAPMSDATIGVIRLGLESALVPYTGGTTVAIFTEEQTAKLTADLKAEATDTKDAAKGIAAKAREIWDRIVKFLREMWGKFTAFLTRLLSAASSLKVRVRSLQNRIAKTNTSVEPKSTILSSADTSRVKDIYDGLNYDGRFTPDALSLLDALHGAQVAVNKLDITMVDRYQLDLNRLAHALQSGDASMISEIANAPLAIPNGFREFKGEQEGERQWVSSALPGNVSLRLTQRAATEGKYSIASYDIDVMSVDRNEQDENEVSVQIPLMMAADMAGLGTRLMKILDETKDGRTLVDRARKAVDSNVDKFRLNATTVRVAQLFHRRYRAVGRLTMKMNSTILKTATRTLDWAALTLDQYPAK